MGLDIEIDDYNVYWKLPIKRIRSHDPAWTDFKWRPIRMGTWNIYKSRNYGNILGFNLRYGYDNGCHNGWGRGYDRFDFSISIFKYTYYFWVKYNFHCSDEGPLDAGPIQKKKIQEHIIKRRKTNEQTDNTKRTD